MSNHPTHPPQNLTQKLIAAHLLGGETRAGAEIQLQVDQLLMHDALSTLTMQALEAMGVERIAIERAWKRHFPSHPSRAFCCAWKIAGRNR